MGERAAGPHSGRPAQHLPRGPVMSRLMRNLWDDDRGGVVSVELVLIIGILVFGLIPGLVALRNSGISLVAGTTTVVQINGVSFTPNPGPVLTASQLPPTTVDPLVVVPPAP